MGNARGVSLAEINKRRSLRTWFLRTVLTLPFRFSSTIRRFRLRARESAKKNFTYSSKERKNLPPLYVYGSPLSRSLVELSLGDTNRGRRKGRRLSFPPPPPSPPAHHFFHRFRRRPRPRRRAPRRPVSSSRTMPPEDDAAVRVAADSPIRGPAPESFPQILPVFYSPDFLSAILYISSSSTCPTDFCFFFPLDHGIISLKAHGGEGTTKEERLPYEATVYVPPRASSPPTPPSLA